MFHESRCNRKPPNAGIENAYGISLESRDGSISIRGFRKLSVRSADDNRKLSQKCDELKISPHPDGKAKTLTMRALERRTKRSWSSPQQSLNTIDDDNDGSLRQLLARSSSLRLNLNSQPSMWRFAIPARPPANRSCSQQTEIRCEDRLRIER